MPLYISLEANDHFDEFEIYKNSLHMNTINEPVAECTDNVQNFLDNFVFLDDLAPFNEKKYVQLRYSPLPGSMSNRSFSNPVLVSGQFCRSLHASVTVDELSGMVKIHSTAPVFRPSSSHLSFLDRLCALPNQSLWDNFVADGDGTCTWIYEGLLSNSLVFMSDCSYNKKLAIDCCSCAAMIRCSLTGRCASVTWVEKSDRNLADNYRAELLGAIVLQLIIHVTCDGKYRSHSMRPRIGCDNKAVVFHGKHPWRPIIAKQAQADLLRYYKTLVCTCPVRCSFYHVHGHFDQLLSHEQLTLEEQLNCARDKLADSALAFGLQSGCYISCVFPREDLVVMLHDTKLTGNYERSIMRSWGGEQARTHYHHHNILPSHPVSSTRFTGMVLNVS